MRRRPVSPFSLPSFTPALRPHSRFGKKKTAGDGWALAALDVGTHRVACVLAEFDVDKPKVLAAEAVPSYGLRDGEIVDLERAGESVRIAVQAVAERAEAEIRSVVVGFSGAMKWSLSRGTLPLPGANHTVSEADVARLRGMIYPECGPRRRVIHRMDGPFKVGDLYGVERPVGLCGSSLTMASTFLTAPAERLRNLFKAVRRTGVDVESLALDPLAASRGALSADERALGAALLDFGAGGFRGALWEGGRLRQLFVYGQDRPAATPLETRSPDGMEGLILDLARHYRIAPSTARRLLCDHGFLDEAETALPGGKAPRGRKALEVAAVDELATVRIEPSELARTIEKLLTPAVRALREGLSAFSSNHAAGVVLVGQGAGLPGLSALVGRHFGGAPVRLGVPRWTMECGGAVPRELDGPGGCALCGLIILGHEARVRRYEQSASSWWGRLRMGLRRAALSL